jgi:hypothetical protein
MTRASSLPLAMLLVACSSSYEGTVQFAIGPELAATGDDLTVTVVLDRFVDDLRIGIARDGQPYRTVGRLDPDVELERFFVEGQRYTFTIPSDDTAKGQVWDFEAILTIGRNESRSISSITIGNTAPTLTASLAPEMPRIADTIVASAQVVDVDGDPTTLAFAWYVNDALTDVTGGEFPALRTVRGDVVRVEVTANDGDDDSAPASAVVTIRNSAPVARVTLTPQRPYTTDLLLAIASGEDPDGDPLTFEYGWTVNGEVVAGLSPEFPPQRTKRGDVIRVTVVARDGRTVSAAVSDETTILNSPPGRAAIGISQSPSGPERDLVCRILTPAPDADRDPLTYGFRWERDTAAWTGATLTTELPGDTIRSADTRIGDTWTCYVTANDGADDGPSASAVSNIVRWAGPRTFTNCRATKQNGPSQTQCDTAYAATTLEGEVEIDAGVQLWVVPVTGTYRIEALGAASKNGDTGYANGKGAKLAGTFDLVAGDLLQIAVGQEGTLSGYHSGGGGGTWVMSEADAPLLIAGGGGGTAWATYRAGCGGATGQYGGLGSGSSTHSCGLKTYDLRLGGRLSTSGWGSGGAGIDTDGASAMGSDGGGKSWRNGVTGGGDSTYAGYGGFGGGGGGNGSSRGGGGGGGYSGGDGGRMAGGGGSFNAGRSQSNTANNNDGHGKVIIDLLD